MAKKTSVKQKAKSVKPKAARSVKSKADKLVALTPREVNFKYETLIREARANQDIAGKQLLKMARKAELKEARLTRFSA